MLSERNILRFYRNNVKEMHNSHSPLDRVGGSLNYKRLQDIMEVKANDVELFDQCKEVAQYVHAIVNLM